MSSYHYECTDSVLSISETSFSDHSEKFLEALKAVNPNLLQGFHDIFTNQTHQNLLDSGASSCIEFKLVFSNSGNMLKVSRFTSTAIS